MTEFLINAKIDPSGVITGSVKVEKQLDRVEKRGRSLQNVLGNLFVGFSLKRGITEAIQTADSYQLLENRLRAVSDAGTDVAEIQDLLNGVANRSRSTFKATADLYARLVVSSKELGRTQGELIKFTERLNKAIILSGASTKEAQNATIQLSQGLASGALRGDELRSVLEQLPAVADVIARGLGVTRGELRKLGEQGRITGSAILDAFEKLGPEIEERFGRTVPTLGQSFTILGNELGSFIDAVNEATNTIPTLSSAVLAFAEAVNLAEGALSNFQSGVRKIEEEGTLASVGAQINNTKKELDALLSRPNQTGLEERIKTLQLRLESLTGAAREATKGVSEEDRLAAVRARTEAAAALKAEKDALNSIRGPQETYEIKLRALNSLLEQGKITSAEYAAAIAKVEANLQKSFGADPGRFLDAQIEKLNQQNDLLRVQLSFGEERARVLQIEQQLRSKGVEITDEERAKLTQLVAVNQNLVDLEKRRNDEAQKKKDLAEQEARQIERLTQQLDVAGQLAMEEERLNQVLLARPDLVGQVSERLEELRLRALESSTAFGDGFERAFIKIKREAEDLAQVGEDVVNVFANNAADAIADFVETGKFNFKDFARSILSDLTKIIARLLVVQALNAAFGGGGSAAVNAAQTGTQLAGARAEGGPVTAGRPFLVGERGPEIFTPSQSGNITPNNEIGQQGGDRPINIINVMDRSMVGEAIAEGDATEAIINVLAENKEVVKETLA